MNVVITRTDPDETTPPIGPDPEPGRQVAVHYHKHYQSFIETYRRLDILHRVDMAHAYADYMSRALGRVIEPFHVLSVWDAALSGDIHLPARAR